MNMTETLWNLSCCSWLTSSSPNRSFIGILTIPMNMLLLDKKYDGPEGLMSLLVFLFIFHSVFVQCSQRSETVFRTLNNSQKSQTFYGSLE